MFLWLKMYGDPWSYKFSSDFTVEISSDFPCPKSLTLVLDVPEPRKLERTQFSKRCGIETSLQERSVSGRSLLIEGFNNRRNRRNTKKYYGWW